MDRASARTQLEVFEDYNCKLLDLPPRSPTFNLIENMSHTRIKALGQRGASKSVANPRELVDLLLRRVRVGTVSPAPSSLTRTSPGPRVRFGLATKELNKLQLIAPPKSAEEKIQQFVQVCERLGVQGHLKACAESMPRRLEECVAKKGGPVKG